MSENKGMWTYWRDKNGIVEGLEEYFPETLKENIRLQIAVAQIKNAEAAIEAVMSEYEEEEYEEDEL